jgi:hypothetical protein
MAAGFNAATSPKTPAGIEICTPPPFPAFQKAFQELPILHTLRSVSNSLGKVVSIIAADGATF